MTELEKLAQWHEKRADYFWQDKAWEPIKELVDHHTAAAATIRAAMAEIERLREALPLIECIARWERENGTIAAIVPAEYRGFCERISCAARRGSPRAALAAQEKEQDA